MAEAPITMRAAGPDDVEKILDLLEEQEFIKPYTREQTRSIFTYEWTDAKPNLGFVVAAGEAIVGFLGLVYSPPRMLDGCAQVTTNPTTLFIHPSYRSRRTPNGIMRYGVELMRFAKDWTSPPIFVLSARGPNDVVPKLLLRLGYEQLCQADRLFRIGGGFRTLCRPAGTVARLDEAAQRFLDEDQRRIHRDHAPHGCGFYLVREADRTSFIVTKRRRYRGEWLWPTVPIARIRRHHFAVSDILHLSDPGVAIRSWGRLVARVCLTERTVGLTCAECILGPEAPAGAAIPQRIFADRGTLAARSVDKLYSELVLLP